MATPKKIKKEDNKTAVARMQAGLDATAGDVGRPTKYKKEYADELVNYFLKAIDAYERVEVPNGEGRVRMELHAKPFPTFQEFAAVHCGVCFDTLFEWSKAKNADGSYLHPEFSSAYARARTLQEAILTKGSMVGAYEGRFAGLAAKNMIGWTDKMESTVEVSGMTAKERADLDNVYQNTLDAANKKKKNKESK